MEQFLAGFALTQMLPGPLTNFAAFIGAIYAGVAGAFLGTLGFFLPGVLLVVGVLPFWDRLRKVPNVRPFLGGLNATGLGLILAVGLSLAFKVIRCPADAVVACLTGGLVGFFGHSSVVGVLSGALAGFLMSPTCLKWGQQPYLE
jgi:chromate transporter